MPAFDNSLAVPVWLLGLLVLLVLGLGLVIWSLKHRRDPRFRMRTDTPLPDLLPTVTGLTHGQLIGGNSAEIVENGKFFDLLLADIRIAQHSIHFETFLWKEGELGRRISEALAERSRAGVCVRVLVDARGGKDMGSDARRRLDEAGCAFAAFHPSGLRAIGRFNTRDHRKLVVIDGRVAYVGGHCIVDNWLGDAEDKEHFRDISVRLRGPVVHAVQSTFSENWVVTTGELFLGDDVFPGLGSEGGIPIHVARITPLGSASAVKILHHLVICCARTRILIQNPYFLPDPQGIDLLAQAVERGVDVRVMSPSTEASDMPVVQHAAHHNFGKLLAHGVRIFEYQKTLLHQKVMTIDGCWSAIGSSNFDDRSFEINDEITLGFHDPVLAAKLETIFASDAEHCVELTSESWARRSLAHRFLDGALYLVNEQL
jgi:cardiolipin synthase